MNGENLLLNGEKMLEIKSKKVLLNGVIKDYFNFLCDLNKYKLLFPQDKINNWNSGFDFCSFKVQNVYTLEMIKVSADNNVINLKSGDSSPFNFTIKIILSIVEDHKCSAQIFCEANLSAALKMMVGKPLNELFNYMASQIEQAISAE